MFIFCVFSYQQNMGFITAEMNLNSSLEKYDIIPDGKYI